RLRQLVRTLLRYRQRVAGSGEIAPVRGVVWRLADGGFECIDRIAVAIDQKVGRARFVACARRRVVELGLDDGAGRAGELEPGRIEQACVRGALEPGGGKVEAGQT